MLVYPTKEKKMNKTARTLLIIGGVLAILGAIGGLIFTVLFYGIAGAAANPDLAAQVKEAIKASYPTYTEAQINEVYDQLVNFSKTAATVQLVLTIFTFLAAVMAFVTIGVKATALSIVCIVLGVLSANIFILIGGIVGVVKRNEVAAA